MNFESSFTPIIYFLGALISLIFLRKHLSKVHTGTRKKINGIWNLSNFGRTFSWHPKGILRPQTFEELQQILLTRRKKGIKRIVPSGSLHSWSACCVTDQYNLDTRALNRVLSVDKKNKRIKAEAGIYLKDLFAEMRKNDMAFPVMPNIDVITLGGAVCNSTHGSSIKYGTFCSLVTEIEILDANGKLWKLPRESQDPQIRRYFDAALVSFGALGVIYSITM